MFKKKTIKIFFLITVFLCIYQKKVYANFYAESEYKINIDVLSNKEAVVEYDVHLVNQGEGFYIRDYSILSGHTDMMNIEVEENGEPVNFKKEYMNDRVRIRISLNKQLVSKGDDTNLKLKYNTQQLLKGEGLIDKLYIPPVQTEEDTERVNFSVNISEEIGDPSYISLSDDEFENKENFKSISYSQDDLPFGLVMIFGDAQQYEFTYNYELNNDSDERKIFTITLPCDTSYQKANFLNTDPIPNRLFTDKEGNNIVEYIIDAGKKMEVKIGGYIYMNKSEETDQLKTEEISEFLKDTEIWNFNNDEVDEVVDKITREDYSNYENAKFIYDYILANYKYRGSQSSDRIDVREIINSDRDLSCENYADLFVGLSRKAGIPSRLVVGFIDIEGELNNFHYWSEFYDIKRNRWVIVDPCLSDVFLYEQFDEYDLSRIVLGYRGLSDSFPRVINPLKKIQGLEVNNLEIKPSSYKYDIDRQNIEFDYQVGDSDIFFNSFPLTLVIKNNSQNIFRIEDVKFDNFEVNMREEHINGDYLEAVFPGQLAKISIDISNLNDNSVERIENYNVEVTGKYGDNNFFENFQFDVKKPLSFYHILSWFFALLTSVVFLMIFLITYRRLKNISFRKKPKYKYKFRKSKMGCINVPVSLS